MFSSTRYRQTRTHPTKVTITRETSIVISSLLSLLCPCRTSRPVPDKPLKSSKTSFSFLWGRGRPHHCSPHRLPILTGLFTGPLAGIIPATDEIGPGPCFVDQARYKLPAVCVARSRGISKSGRVPCNPRVRLPLLVQTQRGTLKRNMIPAVGD